jgi:predicted DNA-binding WGR domain protein
VQIVHQVSQDLYVLFNRWGRIGDDGQYQRTPFPQLADAVKEFCKVFKAKTGNAWHDVKRSVNHYQSLFLCIYCSKVQ